MYPSQVWGKIVDGHVASYFSVEILLWGDFDCTTDLTGLQILQHSLELSTEHCVQIWQNLTGNMLGCKQLANKKAIADHKQPDWRFNVWFRATQPACELLTPCCSLGNKL